MQLLFSALISDGKPYKFPIYINAEKLVISAYSANKKDTWKSSGEIQQIVSIDYLSTIIKRQRIGFEPELFLPNTDFLPYRIGFDAQDWLENTKLLIWGL